MSGKLDETLTQPLLLETNEIPRDDNDGTPPPGETPMPHKKASADLNGHSREDIISSFTYDIASHSSAGQFLYDHHPMLRELLNFQAIYPFLSRSRLIPVDKHREFIPQHSDRSEQRNALIELLTHINDSPDMLEKYLTLFQTVVHSIPAFSYNQTRQGQVDRLLVVLSESQDPKCIEKFINCLNESYELGDAGEGHKNLAETLEASYKKWCEDSRHRQAVIKRLERKSLNLSVQRPNEQRPVKKCCHCGRGWCCCITCCSFVSILLLLIGILAIIVLYVLSREEANPQPTIAYGTDVTELNLRASLGWIATVLLSLSNANERPLTCFGKIHTIHGAKCSDLPMTTTNETNSLGSFLYLLTGSRINITLDAGYTGSYVWILTSVDLALQANLKKIDLGSCDDANPPVSYCYNARYFIGQDPITFKVDSNGYYFVFAPDLYNGNKYFHVTLTKVSYNFSSILSSNQYDIHSYPVTSNKPALFTVNQRWEFRAVCVLFQANCTGVSSWRYANVTSEDIHRRTDVMWFPGLYLISVVVVMIICCSLVLGVLLVCHCVRKRRAHHENLFLSERNHE